VAIYLIAYVLLVYGFSARVDPVAASCGTAQGYYAQAINDDSGSKYGVYAVQYVEGGILCGSSGTAATVSIHSYVRWASNDFIAVGWYKGEAGDASSWQSTLDMYYDGTTNGNYQFSDVSLGESTFMSPYDTVDFTNQYDGSGSSWIIAADDTTQEWFIDVSGITADSSHGSYTQADLESHSSQNTVQGHIYSLENQFYSGGTYYWSNWSTAHYPYCVTENSVTDFSYYTGTGGTC
jgi:hypothetical protein